MVEKDEMPTVLYRLGHLLDVAEGVTNELGAAIRVLEGPFPAEKPVESNVRTDSLLGVLSVLEERVNQARNMACGLRSRLGMLPGDMPPAVRTGPGTSRQEALLRNAVCNPGR